jgi:hypothetical protein
MVPYGIIPYGLPNVPKILVIGQSNGSFFLKIKIELWAHLPLINSTRVISGEGTNSTSSLWKWRVLRTDP